MFSTDKKVVYVTRDAERALGIAPGENYLVVARAGNGTPHLLELEETKRIINDNDAAVLVFKNNQLIEDICKTNGWRLLNPSAALAEKIENKITQVEWLGDLASKYLPTHRVAPTRDLVFGGRMLRSDLSKQSNGGRTTRSNLGKSGSASAKKVIQWAHGHTGDGTVLINSENELRALQAKFPDRMARMTDFVAGPSFTVNVVVSKDKILVGNISYQITGMPPFTDNPFSTVGNDWSAASTLLSESEIEFIAQMACDIGEKMRVDGWRGLFGIDVMKDEELNKIFLIEINARQPASTTYESQLQKSLEPTGISVFEAHLSALLGKQVNQPLTQINDGAQIIQRVTKNVRSVPDDMIGSLELAGYKTIAYPNAGSNSDLIRIQSAKGIIENHGKLNGRGKEIVGILERKTPDKK